MNKETKKAITALGLAVRTLQKAKPHVLMHSSIDKAEDINFAVASAEIALTELHASQTVPILTAADAMSLYLYRLSEGWYADGDKKAAKEAAKLSSDYDAERNSDRALSQQVEGILKQKVNDLQQELKSLKQAAKEQSKTDASFVAEIRNSLIREYNLSLDDPSSKTATMLRDWEGELMKKAGFKDRKALRAWHRKYVGAQNW